MRLNEARLSQLAHTYAKSLSKTQIAALNESFARTPVAAYMEYGVKFNLNMDQILDVLYHYSLDFQNKLNKFVKSRSEPTRIKNLVALAEFWHNTHTTIEVNFMKMLQAHGSDIFRVKDNWNEFFRNLFKTLEQVIQYKP